MASSESKQVIDGCLRESLLPIAMEHLTARDATGIQASDVFGLAGLDTAGRRGQHGIRAVVSMAIKAMVTRSRCIRGWKGVRRRWESSRC